jgi:hypothetical protein
MEGREAQAEEAVAAAREVPAESARRGRNGFDGSPGRGGSITVTYDPQVKPYLNIIHLAHKGGPAPVFNEAPVAPLW